MAITVPSRQKAREGFVHFVTTSPTPGTGLATTATPTSFLETGYFMTVKNTDQLNTGLSIIPDYLKLICTAAGTAGASTHLTVTIDTDVANTRWTSGGSVLTPVGTSGRNGGATVATIHAGALVTVAGPAKRIVSNSIFRTVIPVAGDTYVLVFGDDSKNNSHATLNGTNPVNSVEYAPEVEIPPQWALCFSLWLPSQSAASSWEIEFGHWEGPGT